MSQDFTKAKIYKITNDYNDDVYVGSSCNNLKKRFNNHKSSSKIEGKNTSKLYTLINEIGFERFRIDLIENYPCEDKYQLRQREGYFIREIGTLNINIAGRTKQEYIEENIEMYKKAKTKYRENHKDKANINSKEYYKNNKERLKESIACACGCNITFSNKLRHEKSKKHIKLIESLSNSENGVEILS